MNLKNLSLSAKLFIAAIIWIAVGMLSMRLYFGPGELHGAKATQSVVAGVTMGTLFWVLIIASGLTRALAARKASDIGKRERPRWYKFIWVYFLASGFFSLIDLFIHWNTVVVPANLGAEFPHARTVIFIGTVVITGLGFILWKIISGLSWHEALFGFAGMDGADEREKNIISRASASSLYAAIVLLILTSAVMTVLPVAPGLNYANMMAGISALVIGSRGFFAWKFGLR